MDSTDRAATDQASTDQVGAAVERAIFDWGDDEFVLTRSSLNASSLKKECGFTRSESEKPASEKKGNAFKMDTNDSLEYQSVIKNAALALLAQREQSLKELRQKLTRKFSNEALIDQVLRDLKDNGLQSDERFVESFIRAKKSAGKGPVLIKHELKEKGISEYLIAAYVYENDDEWYELAESVYRKKFGDDQCAEMQFSDLKEKGKRLRFMASRGFPSSIVYGLIEHEFSQP